MKVLLIRHSESFANINDFAAFGNQDSPLTENGIAQSQGLEIALTHMGYEKDAEVAVSTYKRAQQTAEVAGFAKRRVINLIDESALDESVFNWGDNKPIEHHAKDGWIPLETLLRAAQLVHFIQAGYYPFPIYFTHGLFIAGVLTVCKIAGIETNYPFDPERGYVPLRAQVVPLEIG